MKPEISRGHAPLDDALMSLLFSLQKEVTRFLKLIVSGINRRDYRGNEQNLRKIGSEDVR